LFFGLCRILPIDWASRFDGWLGPALGVTAQARRNFACFQTTGGGRVAGLSIESTLADGRRMILFSGHLANWEISPLAAGQYGIDGGLVCRTSNNPFVDRTILKCRDGQR